MTNFATKKKKGSRKRQKKKKLQTENELKIEQKSATLTLTQKEKKDPVENWLTNNDMIGRQEYWISKKKKRMGKEYKWAPNRKREKQQWP